MRTFSKIELTCESYRSATPWNVSAVFCMHFVNRKQSAQSSLQHQAPSASVSPFFCLQLCLLVLGDAISSSSSSSSSSIDELASGVEVMSDRREYDNIRSAFDISVRIEFVKSADTIKECPDPLTYTSGSNFPVYIAELMHATIDCPRMILKAFGGIFCVF